MVKAFQTVMAVTTVSKRSGAICKELGVAYRGDKRGQHTKNPIRVFVNEPKTG
jgi:hypothetical protein